MKRNTWMPRTRGVVLALSLVALSSGAASGQNRMPAQMNRAQMQQMMAKWHPAAREAMSFMTNKYGPPAEMTASMAVWNKTGPWKRTVISAQAVQHNFPGPHPDVMEQVIDYRVPPAMFSALAMYDGSVIVERTKGEMSARCDKEGANFLALNLAHEIATGKRTAGDARRMYAAQVKAMKAGQPAPYTERLLFQPMMGNTADPDRPAM
ncbi:MAG: hypothetical protein H0X52_06855 [Gemmatimonadetes bacterium]|nr:hypothetical protein [Gemmatimonadota bacterium]